MQSAALKIKPYHATANNPLLFNPVLENILVIVKLNSTRLEYYNLTTIENLQATKYHQQKDALSYSWRHHLLNTWLSNYCNKPFDQLNLKTTKEGKNYLDTLPFHFNISKSTTYLAFSFGPNPIGVDIETIKDFKPFMPIADQHFHENEQLLLSEEKSPLSFFSIWTRKEAILKANGSGINDNLKNMDTTSESHQMDSRIYQLETFANDEFIVSLAYQSTDPLLLKMCNYNIL